MELKNLQINIHISLIFILFFLGIGNSEAQNLSRVIDVGSLGGITIPWAINDYRKIVGYSYISGEYHPFLYDTVLHDLGFSGYATDVNDAGIIVGYSFDPVTFETVGLIYSNGNIAYISEMTEAWGINNNNIVVGRGISGKAHYYDGSSHDLPPLAGRLFAFANDINNSDIIIGYSEPFDTIYTDHACAWFNGSPIDLIPSNNVSSIANAINNQGEITGYFQVISPTPSQPHAFITSLSGPLLDIHGLGDESYGEGINDSGVCVGYYVVSVSGESNAFIYVDGIMQDLSDYLGGTPDWHLSHATAINNHGDIAGYGYYNGQPRAFLITAAPMIFEPKAAELWIAGEKDTIKWSGGKKDQILILEYSTDSASTFNLIDFVPNGDTGIYVWDIPKDIISKKCMIKLVDYEEPNIRDTSDVFKIKPYILTRDSSGQYEPYRPEEDQWGFWNRPEDMFPQTWYQQFNYQGIDPFTGSQYSQWQGNFVFASSISAEFPDWVSWVNTFTIDACYISSTLGIYSPTALSRWDAVKKPWHGSCFGIAASNSLAFSYKGQFQTVYSNFPAFANPITVLSNDGVKAEVNELFTHEFGNPTQNFEAGRWNVITPNQTIHEMKEMFKEDNVAIRTLSIWNNNGPGAHNILPYKLEQDFATKNLYYLYVYDSSYPNADAIIKIDTLGNSNNGIWSPLYGWPNWGGSKKFMLENESSVYFNNVTLPKKVEGYISPFILSSEEVKIYTSAAGNTKIIDVQGNVTGFDNAVILEEIPNSFPLTYLNGSETPPYGYSLPTNNYSIILDEFSEDTVKTFFFTNNKTFSYERSGAAQTETDRLFFDGGISAINPDVQTKNIKLLNIINETTQEKLFAVRSIELVQGDSVKIENPDSNKIKLISYGSAKDYDIELNYVTETGIGRFGDFNIPLSANTTHTFEPDWTDITNTQLKILIDEGNDGTIDDTLEIDNQLTGIGNTQGSVLPTEFKLEQNYPNPFNPVTTIRYSIPQRSSVTLKVYDVLGNEVATLVNEEKSRGIYTVSFDGSGLASGMYLYRLQAGSFLETNKMILTK